MMKKIGISLILLALLFNYNKVKAENYQIGDLVELINPEGGESQKFYIIAKEPSGNKYFLLSKNAIYSSLTLNESFEKNKYDEEKFKYIENIEENIINQSSSFYQDTATQIYNCKYTKDKSNNTENKVYLDCPDYYINYINSFTYGYFIDDNGNDVELAKEDNIVIFEKSDNEKYNFMATIHNEEIMNEKKLNHFLWLAIEEQNLNLIRKVENETKTETNTKENTNTIIENNNKVNTPVEENIENPKTSDLIIWIPLSILIICSIATIVYIEKKYKNEKIM